MPVLVNCFRYAVQFDTAGFGGTICDSCDTGGDTCIRTCTGSDNTCTVDFEMSPPSCNPGPILTSSTRSIEVGEDGEVVYECTINSAEYRDEVVCQ